MSRCILCGAELVDGKCPNADSHIKRMCLNCTFFNKEEGYCTNSDNMEAVRKKILEGITVPGGYAIKELSLTPVTLKDPTKKCKQHELDETTVLAEINNIIG